MLVTCWSVKGGSGTTVLATAVAGVLGRRRPGGALLVDLGGDAPHALGIPEPPGPGVAEWLRAGSVAPPDSLTRLAVPASAWLDVVPRGVGSLHGDRVPVLASVLAGESRPVVVDAGLVPTVLDGEGPPCAGAALAAAATRSLLVLRPCQLALHRARRLAVDPTGVVLVREPARALTRRDVEAVLGLPVVAELAVDPAVARAVDAGLAATRLPRSYAVAVERLA